MPFLRRTTMASSILPLASSRALRQSIMGALVFSRSSLTCWAEMFIAVVLIEVTFQFGCGSFAHFGDAPRRARIEPPRSFARQKKGDLAQDDIPTNQT